MEDYEIRNKISTIISNNCIEVEWEGTEVDRDSMENELFDLIKEINDRKT